MLRILANEAWETRISSQLGFKFRINKERLDDATIKPDRKDQVRKRRITVMGNLPSKCNLGSEMVWS